MYGTKKRKTTGSEKKIISRDGMPTINKIKKVSLY